MAEPERLSAAARSAITAQGTEVYVSTASLWEIAIKLSLGRLELAAGWPDIIERERKTMAARGLTILPSHCARVATLPFQHRVPFDRTLVSQAVGEGLSLVTRDEQLRAYDVQCIW